MRYGPLRPVGLEDKQGKDLCGGAIAGRKTKMAVFGCRISDRLRYGEQDRVFRLIPV